jgi:endonuclease/exonuclease/phosphatase (EEP) superfamily protein YafD
MSGVAAIVLTAVAIPSLLARMAGGRPPSPGPQLASLSPLAILPAVVAVALAAASSWWLAVLLAIPAILLVGVQLPPWRPRQGAGDNSLTVRLLTVNACRGGADPAAVVGLVRDQDVGVLAVQELTPELAQELKNADLPGLLPFSVIDAQPSGAGTGLWARWPLRPLPAIPGMKAATPRAQIDPPGRPPVTVTAVHPKAPLKRFQSTWQEELDAIRGSVAATAGAHIVAGDFNASRDHRPFRDLLAVGLVDCGDTALKRPWPGFTWPSFWPGSAGTHPRAVPLMRLDHVLISRDACRARRLRIIRVPGTDHCAVLATIDIMN